MTPTRKFKRLADSDLIQAIVSGRDPDVAFKVLYDRHVPAVRDEVARSRYGVLRTADRLAEIPSIMERARIALLSGRYRETGRFTPWLLKVTRNHLIELCRAQARRRSEKDVLVEDLPSNSPTPSDALDHEELRCIWSNWLDTLSLQNRYVVEAHVLGTSYEVIANELGISKENARQIVHRGRSSFENILEAYGLADECRSILGRC